MGCILFPGSKPSSRISHVFLRAAALSLLHLPLPALSTVVSPQPASIPYGTLFLHSFNDSLALSRSAGWISMSRDLQILCRVMTRQPSLICSELPQASTCQCLPPASQPYCHHSEESGSRPQAEAQPKLSTFLPVQPSQQSWAVLSVPCSLLPTTVLSRTQGLSSPPAAPPVTDDCSFPCSALVQGQPDHSSLANKILQCVLLPTHRSFR